MCAVELLLLFLYSVSKKQLRIYLVHIIKTNFIHIINTEIANYAHDC